MTRRSSSPTSVITSRFMMNWDTVYELDCNRAEFGPMSFPYPAIIQEGLEDLQASLLEISTNIHIVQSID